MMWKLKDGGKRMHYDVQIKRADGQGRALCENQRVDANGGNIMCKLKGLIDKGGLYDVEMKRWGQKGSL